MLSRCPIRYKLLLGVTILFLIVVTLSVSGILGISSYRQLVRSVSNRAAELPLADRLIRSVDDLRITFSAIRVRSTHSFTEDTNYERLAIRESFILTWIGVQDALRRYREQLELVEVNGSGIVGNREEWETVRKIERSLKRINRLNNDEDWFLDRVQVEMLGDELDELHALTTELPSHLHGRMQQLKGNVRGQYHALIGLTCATSVLAAAMLGLFVKFFYDWVFRPLRVLLNGSRRVAAGDFNHRIQLPSHDEMAELAMAMNDMTAGFLEIRDDLNQQVKQRTKEVVRSEQLASLGLLAAGVAHEINNPLASIAWCAEAIESRLYDMLAEWDTAEEGDEEDEAHVVRDYLRNIQDEAFRCKGITEKLLDFSRLGDVERHQEDLRELVHDVVEMVRHLGCYRNKTIEFDETRSVLARVNTQEIKQVVLNLITNALDSLDENGRVDIVLQQRGNLAELVVKDNGCGMSDEVLEHLFEPFYTRRRDGQGTGLGLSISYLIVSDHGGSIQAHSDGPGTGSEFRVTLPILDHEKNEQQAGSYAA